MGKSSQMQSYRQLQKTKIVSRTSCTCLQIFTHLPVEKWYKWLKHREQFNFPKEPSIPPQPSDCKQKGSLASVSPIRDMFGKFHVKIGHLQKIKSLENYTRAVIAIANLPQTSLPPCNESSRGQGEVISKMGLEKRKERLKQGAGKNGCLSSSPFVLGVTSLIFSYI